MMAGNTYCSCANVQLWMRAHWRLMCTRRGCTITHSRLMQQSQIASLSETMAFPDGWLPSGPPACFFFFWSEYDNKGNFFYKTWPPSIRFFCFYIKRAFASPIGINFITIFPQPFWARPGNVLGNLQQSYINAYRYKQPCKIFRPRRILFKATPDHPSSSGGMDSSI